MSSGVVPRRICGRLCLVCGLVGCLCVWAVLFCGLAWHYYAQQGCRDCESVMAVSSPLASLPMREYVRPSVVVVLVWFVVVWLGCLGWCSGFDILSIRSQPTLLFSLLETGNCVFISMAACTPERTIEGGSVWVGWCVAGVLLWCPIGPPHGGPLAGSQ